LFIKFIARPTGFGAVRSVRLSAILQNADQDRVTKSAHHHGGLNGVDDYEPYIKRNAS
jgi:hypothetical protein